MWRVVIEKGVLNIITNLYDLMYLCLEQRSNEWGCYDH